MREAIFWGGRGHARVLNEALIGADVKLVAIFDSRDVASPLSNVPLHVGRDGLDRWLANRPADAIRTHFAIAIGGDKGHDRVELHAWLAGKGLAPLTIVHPRAWVAADASLGTCSQVLAGALVASHVLIGDDAIVNTGASIDHDCVIARGVHVGPGAVLAGEITVDEFAFIGAGATILPGLRIGAAAIVGAGAVVTSDVPPGSIVVGSPARPISKRRGT